MQGMIFDVRINLSELSKDLSDKPRMIHFLLRRAHGKGYALKVSLINIKIIAYIACAITWSHRVLSIDVGGELRAIDNIRTKMDFLGYWFILYCYLHFSSFAQRLSTWKIYPKSQHFLTASTGFIKLLSQRSMSFHKAACMSVFWNKIFIRCAENWRLIFVIYFIFRLRELAIRHNRQGVHSKTDL